MRKTEILSLALIIFEAAIALGQGVSTASPTDLLGVHLNYGRGCHGCHVQHRGAYGNASIKTAGASADDDSIWGQGIRNGKTITTNNSDLGTSGAKATNLPAATPDAGLLICLCCHDGNWAESAMMENTVFESLPATYGAHKKIPTLLDDDQSARGSYLSAHPVGMNTQVRCGGPDNWDCTMGQGSQIIMNGPSSSRFVANYGFFVALSGYYNRAVVTCTACHNQHLMNVVAVKTGQNTGLPTGLYPTKSFLRAPYNPDHPNPFSNQAAQFCRQCHGGMSNEANGGNTGTIF